MSPAGLGTSTGSIPPALSTEGLRLRIHTLSAQKREALQRLADLHRVAGGDQEATPGEVASEELDNTRRELGTLNQAQCELEIALAKACARGKLEPRLQTACGACLRFRQKLTVHRAELDRQFEALRGEMGAATAELARGREEARAAGRADLVHREAEEVHTRQAEAHAREFEDLQRGFQEGQSSLRGLAAQASHMTEQARTLLLAQRDLAVKYQNVAEACWKAFEDLKALQQQQEQAQPVVQAVQDRIAHVSGETEWIRSVLHEVQKAAAETANTARDFVPLAEERLQASEAQIAELTKAFTNLEGKHGHLNDQMQDNQKSMDSLDQQVDQLKSWVQIQPAGK